MQRGSGQHNACEKSLHAGFVFNVDARAKVNVHRRRSLFKLMQYKRVCLFRRNSLHLLGNGPGRVHIARRVGAAQVIALAGARRIEGIVSVCVYGLKGYALICFGKQLFIKVGALQ